MCLYINVFFSSGGSVSSGLKVPKVLECKPSCPTLCVCVCVCDSTALWGPMFNRRFCRTGSVSDSLRAAPGLGLLFRVCGFSYSVVHQQSEPLPRAQITQHPSGFSHGCQNALLQLLSDHSADNVNIFWIRNQVLNTLEPR